MIVIKLILSLLPLWLFDQDKVHIRIWRFIIDVDELFYSDRQTGECYQIRQSPSHGDYWCRRVRSLTWRLWWLSSPDCLQYKLDRELKPILTARRPK